MIKYQNCAAYSNNDLNQVMEGRIYFGLQIQRARERRERREEREKEGGREGLDADLPTDGQSRKLKDYVPSTGKEQRE